MIGPSQRPVPDNTQHSQETDVYAPDGIRTRNPSKLAAADPRLRPRGHWALDLYNTESNLSCCRMYYTHLLTVTNDVKSLVPPQVYIIFPLKIALACILVSSYQLNAHFLYSITIYMLHYNPQHVSSNTLLIFRRTNCIIPASGIVTLCTVCRLRADCIPPSTGILYGRLHRVTIPEAIIIKFVLLKMSKVLLETC